MEPIAHPPTDDSTRARRNSHLERFLLGGGVAAAVTLAGWAVLPSFEPLPIASSDGWGHLVRLALFKESVSRPALGIFGVYDGWYLGTPIFLFYPPGFYVVVSALQLATLGLLDDSQATKVVLAAGYIAFPVVVAWLARRLGFGLVVSAAAGLLALSFHARWNMGLTGVYDTGLYTRFFGLAFFALYWGTLDRLVRSTPVGDRALARTDGRSPGSAALAMVRQTAPLALALAAVILTNIVVSTFIPFLFLFYLLTALVTKPRVVPRLVMAHGLGLGLSAFWAYPFLKSLPYRGPPTQWTGRSLPELLRYLFIDHEAFPWIVTVGATVALLLLSFRLFRRRQMVPTLTLAGVSALVLLISSTTFTGFARTVLADVPMSDLALRITEQAYQTQALQFLWVSLPILAAAGLEGLAQMVKDKVGEQGGRPLGIGVSALTLLLVGVVAFQSLAGARQSSVRTFSATPGLSSSHVQGQMVAAWLSRHADPSSVVLVYRGNADWYRGINSMLALSTGLRMVDGDQPEAAHADFRRAGRSPQMLGSRTVLRQIGVDYVVMLEGRRGDGDPPSGPKATPPASWTISFATRDLTIYASSVRSGVVGTPVALNTYRFSIRTREGPTEVPLQFNPHWKGAAEAVRIDAGNLGLTRVNAPPDQQEVELIFAPTRDELLVFALSSAILGGLLGVYALVPARGLRRVSRTATIPSKLRKRLSLREGDRMVLSVRQGEVVLRPAGAFDLLSPRQHSGF